MLDPAPATPAAASATTALCICVDDFGLHEAINEAVLRLAEGARISSTSAMVRGAAWADGAARLRRAGAPRVEVGLHLDFTEPLIEGGLVRLPLPRLIVASYARRLDPARLRRAITLQLDAFEAELGRPPAFVDGHQHVHQLPQVRDALLDVLAARYAEAGARPWLRSTRPRRGWLGSLAREPKAAVIAALGEHALRRRALRRGFRLNGTLLGVYDFAVDAGRYQDLLDGWLTHARSGDVLMCHPAAAPVPGDQIAAARTLEFAVLNSAWFAHRLQQADHHAAPFCQPSAASLTHGR